MANDGLHKIQLELEELQKFYSEATFDRTKEVLKKEMAKIEAEINMVKSKLAAAETKTPKEPSTKVKRINVQLTEHAFDQSEKFVKIFVPFDQAVQEDNVKVEFTQNSLSLLVQTEAKDYRFVVEHLLKEIDVSKSYRKVKSDMIAIYCKKVKEEKWEYLTVTEKRLKDIKTKMFEDDKDGAKDDPMGGLMSIMKKMYESGDSDMKRTIAKAWTEGQEKKNQAPM